MSIESNTQSAVIANIQLFSLWQFLSVAMQKTYLLQEGQRNALCMSRERSNNNAE
jgi:hypothetical protein